jgi:hypothetical protein
MAPLDRLAVLMFLAKLSSRRKNVCKSIKRRVGGELYAEGRPAEMENGARYELEEIGMAMKRRGIETVEQVGRIASKSHRRFETHH